MKDTAKFQADFTLERKAEVHEEDGDLIIEGYAADWLLDRQDEAFEPGAFEMGLKSFMERNPILIYHHHYDQALGQVVEAENRPDGLWVKARVDKPAAGSWAEDIYGKIKKGTIRGFSVGGYFKRRKGPDGKPRIHEVDFAELSVTPFPINPRTMFAVAGKAFTEAEASDARQLLGERLARLEGTLDALQAKAEKDIRKPPYAMEGGKLPITHCGNDSFSNGAARNRAHQVKGVSQEAAMAHIRKREKALGCKSPDDE